MQTTLQKLKRYFTCFCTKLGWLHLVAQELVDVILVVFLKFKPSFFDYHWCFSAARP